MNIEIIAGITNKLFYTKLLISTVLKVENLPTRLGTTK